MAFLAKQSFAMPRAPKPCKKKGKGEAVAEDGPKMARMVDGLAQSCRAWGGKKQGGKLPSEAIQKLSQEVSELKMASWQGQGGSLPDLAILDEVLPGIFRALERSNGAKSRAKESETRELGLWPAVGCPGAGPLGVPGHEASAV